MTKATFISSSLYSDLEFSSVNHTSIYESSKSNVRKNIKFLGEISNNWSNDLLGANVHKTIESSWQLLWKMLICTNTTSEISNWGTFSPFSSVVILPLVLPNIMYVFLKIYSKQTSILDTEYVPSICLSTF